MAMISRVLTSLLPAGAGISKEFGVDITKFGAVMIDNSSAFRKGKRHTLVVEVNAADAKRSPARE